MKSNKFDPNILGNSKGQDIQDNCKGKEQSWLILFSTIKSCYKSIIIKRIVFAEGQIKKNNRDQKVQKQTFSVMDNLWKNGNLEQPEKNHFYSRFNITSI